MFNEDDILSFTHNKWFGTIMEEGIKLAEMTLVGGGEMSEVWKFITNFNLELQVITQQRVMFLKFIFMVCLMKCSSDIGYAQMLKYKIQSVAYM